MDSHQSTARYQPTAAEVHEFARFLGISPVTDARFLWIAEEALVAPLPSGWSEHVSDEGYSYFYNEETHESTWEPPTAATFKELFTQLKLAEQREKESRARKHKNTLAIQGTWAAGDLQRQIKMANSLRDSESSVEPTNSIAETDTRLTQNSRTLESLMAIEPRREIEPLPGRTDVTIDAAKLRRMSTESSVGLSRPSQSLSLNSIQSNGNGTELSQEMIDESAIGASEPTALAMQSALDKVGKVRVVVLAASLTRSVERFGKQDPYAKVSLMPWAGPDQCFQTLTKWNSGTDCVWTEDDGNTRELRYPGQPANGRVPFLHVELWDKEHVLQDRLIGSGDLDISDFVAAPGVGSMDSIANLRFRKREVGVCVLNVSFVEGEWVRSTHPLLLHSSDGSKRRSANAADSRSDVSALPPDSPLNNDSAIIAIESLTFATDSLGDTPEETEADLRKSIAVLQAKLVAAEHLAVKSNDTSSPAVGKEGYDTNLHADHDNVPSTTSTNSIGFDSVPNAQNVIEEANTQSHTVIKLAEAAELPRQPSLKQNESKDGVNPLVEDSGCIDTSIVAESDAGYVLSTTTKLIQAKVNGEATDEHQWATCDDLQPVANDTLILSKTNQWIEENGSTTGNASNGDNSTEFQPSLKSCTPDEATEASKMSDSCLGIASKLPEVCVTDTDGAPSVLQHDKDTNMDKISKLHDEHGIVNMVPGERVHGEENMKLAGKTHAADEHLEPQKLQENVSMPEVQFSDLFIPTVECELAKDVSGNKGLCEQRATNGRVGTDVDENCTAGSEQEMPENSNDTKAVNERNYSGKDSTFSMELKSTENLCRRNTGSTTVGKRESPKADNESTTAVSECTNGDGRFTGRGSENIGKDRGVDSVVFGSENILEVHGEWELCADDDGNLFYYNSRTNESTWTRPVELQPKSEDLVVGRLIEAAFEGKERWYPGRIAAVHINDTFTVAYDDGDREESVTREFIRLIEDGSGVDDPVKGPTTQDIHGSTFGEGLLTNGNCIAAAPCDQVVINVEDNNGARGASDCDEKFTVAHDLTDVDMEGPQPESTPGEQHVPLGGANFTNRAKSTSIPVEDEVHLQLISKNCQGITETELVEVQEERTDARTSACGTPRSNICHGDNGKNPKDSPIIKPDNKDTKSGLSAATAGPLNCPKEAGVESRNDGKTAIEELESNISAAPCFQNDQLPQQPPPDENAVGLRVNAAYEGGKRWFPGKITAANKDGTYSVAYDDGDFEAFVRRDLIHVVSSEHPPRSLPTSPTPTSAVNANVAETSMQVKAGRKGSMGISDNVMASNIVPPGKVSIKTDGISCNLTTGQREGSPTVLGRKGQSTAESASKATNQDKAFENTIMREFVAGGEEFLPKSQNAVALTNDCYYKAEDWSSGDETEWEDEEDGERTQSDQSFVLPVGVAHDGLLENEIVTLHNLSKKQHTLHTKFMESMHVPLLRQKALIDEERKVP